LDTSNSEDNPEPEAANPLSPSLSCFLSLSSNFSPTHESTIAHNPNDELTIVRRPVLCSYEPYGAPTKFRSPSPPIDEEITQPVPCSYEPQGASDVSTSFRSSSPPIDVETNGEPPLQPPPLLPLDPSSPIPSSVPSPSPNFDLDDKHTFPRREPAPCSYEPHEAQLLQFSLTNVTSSTSFRSLSPSHSNEQLNNDAQSEGPPINLHTSPTPSRQSLTPEPPSPVPLCFVASLPDLGLPHEPTVARRDPVPCLYEPHEDPFPRSPSTDAY
jgi:hypothetical protein